MWVFLVHFKRARRCVMSLAAHACLRAQRMCHTKFALPQVLKKHRTVSATGVAQNHSTATNRHTHTHNCLPGTAAAAATGRNKRARLGRLLDTEQERAHTPWRQNIDSLLPQLTCSQGCTPLLRQLSWLKPQHALRWGLKSHAHAHTLLRKS